MLDNRYGRFIDDGAAYEITDWRTPMPWVNVICNGSYGTVVSQAGGGFSWLDHCQLNVITRWEMDLARDDRGRFIYLRDLDVPGGAPGAIWSLAPQPCRVEYDAYSCVHRAGSTTYRTAFNSIEAEWTIAVAAEAPGEVWRVRLTNKGDKKRRLRIASFHEWCCGAAPDIKREFHRLFFTTSLDRERSAIVATKNMWEAPFGSADDHWNRPWPHAAAISVSGIDAGRLLATADKRDFYGCVFDAARPQAMVSDHIELGSFGRFGDASAALGGDLELAPGETITLGFAIAVTDDEASAATRAHELAQPARVDDEIEASVAGWTRRLTRTGVESGREELDALVNTWLPYQAISGRLWGRTGYYQQSGAFGYRDQLQDSQVWFAIEPARARAQILHHAAHQFKSGRVYHWWNPITETGNITECSDDYLWLPFITAAYIRETGDASILDETARFVDDEQGATLREHCRRAITNLLERRTDRGLPLIGDMDWNDGLSALGSKEVGESIWLCFFGAEVLARWAHVEREWSADKSAELAATYETDRTALLDAANEHAWDGSWYRRATDKHGRWLGSSESDAGQIFLNAQTWAVLVDGGPADRLAAAWASAKERLLTDYGPLLLAPAYTDPDPDVGYITRYAPGARENGGVYMHAATWALAAACKQKDADAATRIWESIAPPTRGLDADAYHAEPYVLPGNVDGPLSDLPGRAGWTWYTGSASWLHRVTLEWILGLRAEWGGLRIDPCPIAQLAREGGEVRARRLYRTRTVEVTIDTADADTSADASGAAPAGARIWLINEDGSREEVEGGLLTHELIEAAPEGGTVRVLAEFAGGRAKGEIEARAVGAGASVGAGPRHDKPREGSTS